jgi:putative transcriptional regulator|tara:strand:- start:2042 stop:2587 length:546 start_codon:yes stop_codon:yes gene_type:complete
MKNLKNKLLISMPNMVDPYFAKSVIFIFEDGMDGTTGIIINKPVSEMKIVNSGIKNKIFEDILNESKKIFFGGPINLNEVCVIESILSSEIDFSKKIQLSTDLDLIKKILFNDNSPDGTRLIFGHAGWEKQQLCNEIKRGDWIIQEYDSSIFNVPPQNLWQEMIHTLGLDEFNVIGAGGMS